eukprot:TRINITY_DN1308_c0_g2_i1.p1 TRINITY_DN1308_c0_g2~~TRINITY_DN1308_c0_g2_i1.p1  ORF type:complete len:734 (-),score=272.40 TRINITY_DN1308_c0_g2_i1:78-2279(-)
MSSPSNSNFNKKGKVINRSSRGNSSKNYHGEFPNKNLVSPLNDYQANLNQYINFNNYQNNNNHHTHHSNNHHSNNNYPNNYTNYSYSSSSSYQKNSSLKTNNFKFNNFFSKEKFVRSNFRFGLKPNSPCKFDAIYDPDAELIWDDIAQVYVTSPSELNCPICLEIPKAAKIAKCGHIFCWGCFLQYLSFTQNSFRRCPICFESIYKHHLKSVEIKLKSNLTEGDFISFSLMKRKKSSLFPSMHNQNLPNLKEQIFPTEQNPYAMFARILFIEDLLLILNREMKEIKEQVAISEFETIDTLAFWQEAQTELQKQMSDYNRLKSKLKSKNNNQESLIFFQNDVDSNNIQENEFEFNEYLNNSNTNQNENINVNSECKENLFIYPNKQSEDINRFADYYFFFQENSGLLIYLHSVSIKCLVQEYGALEFCPQIIQGKILEIKEHILTEDYRNKCKFLSHLPIGSQISFCEIDTSPYVSDQSIAIYELEIKMRAEQRQKLKLQQKREENLQNIKNGGLRWWEKIEQQYAAFQVSVNPDIHSENDWPTIAEALGKTINNNSPIDNSIEQNINSNHSNNTTNSVNINHFNNGNNVNNNSTISSSSPSPSQLSIESSNQSTSPKLPLSFAEILKQSLVNNPNVTQSKKSKKSKKSQVQQLSQSQPQPQSQSQSQPQPQPQTQSQTQVQVQQLSQSFESQLTTQLPQSPNKKTTQTKKKPKPKNKKSKPTLLISNSMQIYS